MLTTIIYYYIFRTNLQVTMDCLWIAVPLATEVSPNRGHALAVRESVYARRILLLFTVCR